VKIILAEEIGFCYGVKRAYENAVLYSEKNNIYIYGELVHNSDVIMKLEEDGIKMFTDIDNLPEDSKESTVIIRAHGISFNEEKILRENFSEVVDMTCPIVKNVIKIARELQDKGYFLVIYGDVQHPEMRGLKGNTDEKMLIITKEPQIIFHQKVAVMSQTTVAEKKFEDFSDKLIEINKFSDIIIKNTICKETVKREKEAVKIASVSDSVIVMGGKNSSNTKKLFEISKKINKNTFYIVSPDETENFNIKGETIGIITGASTPSWDIKKLLANLDKSNFS